MTSHSHRFRLAFHVTLALSCPLAGCGTSASRPPDSAITGDAADTADVAFLDDSTSPPLDAGTFKLTSGEFQDQGTLPVEFTCDGAGTSPPLAWTGVPEGTVELALLMTTQAKDGLKWNWVLFHIPATTSAIPAGATGIGVAGLTSDGPQLAYAPPCSQGPGLMGYTFTLYALSGVPALAADARLDTGAVVTAAITPLILRSSQLTVTYTR